VVVKSLNDSLCFQEVYAEVVKLLLFIELSFLFSQGLVVSFGKQRYSQVSNIRANHFRFCYGCGTNMVECNWENLLKLCNCNWET
jgi:hypothetical protein